MDGRLGENRGVGESEVSVRLDNQCSNRVRERDTARKRAMKFKISEEEQLPTMGRYDMI